MIRKLLRKLKLNKQPGFSEFLYSIFSILAMATFVFIMIQYMGDVSTRISLDQIARKYILQIESTGKLTNEMADNIINDVKGLSIVDKNKEVVVEVYDENNNRLGRNVSASYGSTVRLEITCNVNKTTFVPTGTFGNWNRKTSVPITITKQSTAKY